EQRILEAEKLGFKKIFVSKFNKFSKKNYSIEVVLVSKVEEVFNELF
ncbi:MAG: DNA repair protein RadA/Sms, partial [Urechidicola sp.]